MNKRSRIAAFITASIMTLGLAMTANSQITKAITSNPSAEKTIVRDNMTTTQLVADMGLGWNLGNTLESCGSWITGNSVSSYETAWGAPITTKAMIDGVHNAGFNSIRIPVAWSNLMAADYTISPALLSRVEEVANYALDNNMYVIINLHWDSGWLAGFSTNYDECMKKYKSIWTQLSERFANYGDHLIFESLNEEACFNDIWNRWGGTTGKDKAYGIANNINQAFVDLIRSSKGNNPKRHLLIAGYATDIPLTCDPLYKMPTDPANRCAVSVHYYTPSTFTILEQDADWGKARTTWGTAEDVAELQNYMNMMKVNFIDKGVPVIVGEYGTNNKNKTTDMVRLYLTSVAKEAYKLGMCPMLWDAGNMVMYDRNACQFKDPQFITEMKTIRDTARPTTQIIYGDLNNDKKVNAIDFALMKKYILDNSTPIDLKIADLNGDGKVNALDYAVFKKFLLGQITKFPVQS
ncbi:cellulase family glycosylhydrolase [Clostridium cellulovorans]|uniref:Glycoside hydrolase family 5 n=2 Tax=Clostridium cellulovorans TaxID=1493 RepID=D9STR7_CLOC7|nr:cellulase family glycosylhydrolase [Clostridium cellulovorans]ADL52801.1 glycoside hydrolase family 5 [Clostridium cellulovorans 743B]BAV13032.1 endoglucanase [Clostridium cellulovorans]